MFQIFKNSSSLSLELPHIDREVRPFMMVFVYLYFLHNCMTNHVNILLSSLSTLKRMAVFNEISRAQADYGHVCMSVIILQALNCACILASVYSRVFIFPIAHILSYMHYHSQPFTLVYTTAIFLSITHCPVLPPHCPVS